MNSIFRSVFLFFMIIMLTTLALPLPESYGQLSSGDILMTDESAGTGGLGALFRVDPITGVRTILSDFGDVTQGPTGSEVAGVAVESSGNILVTDETGGTGGLGALFRIDPITGVRTILSDFSVAAQGPLGDEVSGVAVEASGTILVTDEGVNILFRIDPVTGVRTILSDFGDAGQGPTGDDPDGVAVEASGRILVTESSAGTGGLGALFRIDPITGTRTILSNFGDAVQGPTGTDLAGVAVEPSGDILVLDEKGGTGSLGALYRVNPATGIRTLLSNFGDATQGPTGSEPGGVAVDFSGNIFVTDDSEGVLFRINPITGTRITLLDADTPERVAVYPVIPAPVGGYVVPSNKLAILTPYIVLAGLIAAVSVAIIRRRKD